MDVGNTKVVKATLIAYREEYGGYIVYVFDIGGMLPYDKYMMCTRFPRWETPMLHLGDCGYLKYREVIAGKDAWYDNATGQEVPYKYTGVHFLDFIEEKKDDGEIII